MARPSEQEVEEALVSLLEIVRTRSAPVAMAGARAIGVLREATRLRRVLLSKEAAARLRVDPSNLNPQSVAGLPEPVATFPRPTKRHPDRVVRVWDEEEIDDCARAKWARLGQSREDGAK